jgi:polyphosphate kinase 2 (PPK2 family)
MGQTDVSEEQKPLKRKKYEKELSELQAELCKLQEWVRHKGQRVVIVFEGRDAAGKGGTIKAITERVSPRVFRRRGPARALGPREIADVHAALHESLPRGR